MIFVIYSDAKLFRVVLIMPYIVLFSLKTTKITRWNNHLYQYSQNWRGAYRGADNKKEGKMPCHLLFIYRESLIFITDSYWIKKIMNLTNSKCSKPL